MVDCCGSGLPTGQDVAASSVAVCCGSGKFLGLRIVALAVTSAQASKLWCFISLCPHHFGDGHGNNFFDGCHVDEYCKRAVQVYWCAYCLHGKCTCRWVSGCVQSGSSTGLGSFTFHAYCSSPVSSWLHGRVPVVVFPGVCNHKVPRVTSSSASSGSVSQTMSKISGQVGSSS